MSEKAEKAHCVYCLWKWNSKSKPRSLDQWKLVEAYAANDNGYPLEKGKINCDDFMDKKVPYKNNDEDYELESIMGRCVTLWTFAEGVSLLRFHPPEDCKWLSIRAIEEIRKLPHWFSIIEDGGTLLFGTERAARKIIMGG